MAEQYAPEDESRGFPSMEEFYQRVKYYFCDGWPNLSDDVVEEYLHTGSAMERIQQEYDLAKRDYEAGKTTRNVVMHGNAASAGMCLEYMY